MTSVPPEEVLEEPTVDSDFDAAQTDRFEFGKGYDLSYFQDIRVYVFMMADAIL